VKSVIQKGHVHPCPITAKSTNMGQGRKKHFSQSEDEETTGFVASLGQSLPAFLALVQVESERDSVATGYAVRRYLFVANAETFSNNIHGDSRRVNAFNVSYHPGAFV